LKRAGITLLLFLCSVTAVAETLRGVVQNSTINKPSAGDEVTLKKIGNGMEDVGKPRPMPKASSALMFRRRNNPTSFGSSTRA
jgi:hypothetical protein